MTGYHRCSIPFIFLCPYLWRISLSCLSSLISISIFLRYPVCWISTAGCHRCRIPFIFLCPYLWRISLSCLSSLISISILLWYPVCWILSCQSSLISTSILLQYPICWISMSLIHWFGIPFMAINTFCHILAGIKNLKMDVLLLLPSIETYVYSLNINHYVLYWSLPCPILLHITVAYSN